MAGAGFTNGLEFSVRDWFAWTPGRETRPEWRNWASASVDAPEESAEPMPTLPMMLRRRVTSVGQKAVGAALACQGADAARYVIASRHGEYDRTVSIFTSLAEQEAPSPAEFSMSVHNGLAGLLSIHTANRLGHVAISAAQDSFAYGMMEAALCLAEDPATPVLLLYYDPPLPDSYDPFRAASEAELPTVVALLLESAHEVSFQWQPSQPTSALADSQALHFLRWLLSGAEQAECRGERMTWRWSRVH